MEELKEWDSIRQNVIEHGADVLISGHCGQKPFVF
jgi:predicted Fe-Mo cluster-binding NifX family protein